MVRPKEIEGWERSKKHGTCPVCDKYLSYKDFIDVRQEVQGRFGYDTIKQIRYCSWEHFWEHKEEKKKKVQVEDQLKTKIGEIASDLMDTYQAIKHGSIEDIRGIIIELDDYSNDLSELAKNIEEGQYRL